MGGYKSKRTTFIAIRDNAVIASGRSGRELARQLPQLGKSHVWYSRKFSDNDYFLFSFEGVTVHFYKITV